jgi:uncharacterized membrane protein (UPF0127 family)
MLKVNNKLLMKKVKHAKTSWQRTKGLMFEEEKQFDYALVFDFPNESKIGTSLHMIFVFFPIDVLFLNSKKEVVDKTTMTPFQPNYTPKKAAKYVIEMPNGKNKKVKIGDKISW